MNLHAKLGMLVLTRQEQRAIAFIVLMLVLGLATKHYRHRHPEPAKMTNETAKAQQTPTISRP
jgi:hypothetical protein